MKDHSFIGKEIKNIRKYYNITQKELANKSNVSEQTLRRCELGEFDTKLSSLADILGSLNISFRKLFLYTNGSKLHEINNLFLNLNYYLKINNLDKAKETYEYIKSFDFCKYERHIRIEIKANLKFYEALYLELYQKEYKFALEKYLESIEIYNKDYDINNFRKFNYNQNSLYTLLKISNLLLKMKIKKEQSKDILFYVYDILGDNSFISNYLTYNIAVNYYLEKNYNKSLKYTIKSIDISKKLFDMGYINLLYYLLAKIYSNTNRNKQSMCYQRNAEVLSNIMYDSRDRLDYLDAYFKND